MANRLVIGTRRYSSWSLRGWLAVRLAGLDVIDEVVSLAGGGQTHRLREISPNGCVPYLEHEGARVWESLAIGLYCAEHEPALLPEDRIARAHGLSICAQMHAGFAALRRALPMNEGRRARARSSDIGDDARADITAIAGLWRECLQRSGGPFLFGARMTLPDCMFAPIASRFASYAVALPEDAQAYCDSLRAHPLMQAWANEAAQEPHEWHLARFEDLD